MLEENICKKIKLLSDKCFVRLILQNILNQFSEKIYLLEFKVFVIA
jgi:hypothetical protein